MVMVSDLVWKEEEESAQKTPERGRRGLFYLLAWRLLASHNEEEALEGTTGVLKSKRTMQNEASFLHV